MGTTHRAVLLLTGLLGCERAVDDVDSDDRDSTTEDDGRDPLPPRPAVCEGVPVVDCVDGVCDLPGDLLDERVRVVFTDRLPADGPVPLRFAGDEVTVLSEPVAWVEGADVFLPAGDYTVTAERADGASLPVGSVTSSGTGEVSLSPRVYTWSFDVRVTAAAGAPGPFSLHAACRPEALDACGAVWQTGGASPAYWMGTPPPVPLWLVRQGDVDEALALGPAGSLLVGLDLALVDVAIDVEGARGDALRIRSSAGAERVVPLPDEGPVHTDLLPGTYTADVLGPLGVRPLAEPLVVPAGASAAVTADVPGAVLTVRATVDEVAVVGALTVWVGATGAASAADAVPAALPPGTHALLVTTDTHAGRVEVVVEDGLDAEVVVPLAPLGRLVADGIAAPTPRAAVVRAVDAQLGVVWEGEDAVALPQGTYDVSVRLREPPADASDALPYAPWIPLGEVVVDGTVSLAAALAPVPVRVRPAGGAWALTGVLDGGETIVGDDAVVELIPGYHQLSWAGGALPGTEMTVSPLPGLACVYVRSP